MHTKSLATIKVASHTINVLLIIYSALVRYFRDYGNPMGQWISTLSRACAPLRRRFCKILS
jgi:uncharacterized protein YggT (Ycf19 family)